MDLQRIKKILNSQNGNTLILTIIVFSVILISGTSLLAISSMATNRIIYEEENQQAYYIAKSALDATITAFENPSDDNELQKLVSSLDGGSTNTSKTGSFAGGEYEVELSREGSQIKITSTGIYKEKRESISAYLDEVIIPDVEGNTKAVIIAKKIEINSNEDLVIEGDLIAEQIVIQGQGKVKIVGDVIGVEKVEIVSKHELEIEGNVQGEEVKLISQDSAVEIIGNITGGEIEVISKHKLKITYNINGQRIGLISQDNGVEIIGNITGGEIEVISKHKLAIVGNVTGDKTELKSQDNEIDIRGNIVGREEIKINSKHKITTSGNIIGSKIEFISQDGDIEIRGNMIADKLIKVIAKNNIIFEGSISGGIKEEDITFHPAPRGKMGIIEDTVYTGLNVGITTESWGIKSMAYQNPYNKWIDMLVSPSEQQHKWEINKNVKWEYEDKQFVDISAGKIDSNNNYEHRYMIGYDKDVKGNIGEVRGMYIYNPGGKVDVELNGEYTGVVYAKEVKIVGRGKIIRQPMHSKNEVDNIVGYSEGEVGEMPEILDYLNGYKEENKVRTEGKITYRFNRYAK